MSWHSSAVIKCAHSRGRDTTLCEMFPEDDLLADSGDKHRVPDVVVEHVGVRNVLQYESFDHHISGKRRLRVPVEGRIPMKPITVAQFDERPRVTTLPDGSLLGVYISQTSDQHVGARRSTSSGHSWSEPEVLFALPESGCWGGCETLVDREGELHFFTLNDRGTRVFLDPTDEGQRSES